MDTSVATGYGADRVTNLGLMSKQQNMLMLGGIAFISGIILFALHKLKQTNEEKLAEQEDSELRKKKALGIADTVRDSANDFWSKYGKGERIVIVAAFITFLSFFLTWDHFENSVVKALQAVRGGDYSGDNRGPAIYDIVVLLLLWAYPVLMLIKNRAIDLKIGMTCAVLSVLWLFYHLHMIGQWEEALGDTAVSAGLGLGLSLIASFMLAIGILSTARQAEVAKQDHQ